MLKRCAIIGNGYYHGESMVNQIKSIAAELTALSVEVDVIYTDRILSYFDGDGVISTIGEYDFIIFLDKDVYLSHMLEKSGYKLVNSAKSIELCDDKLKTFVALSGAGINLPMTISSPLNYAGKDDDIASHIGSLLGFPVVVKEVFGSMGKTVYLAEDISALRELRKALIKRPHLYQRFIGKGGRDIRVMVIGGKALAAMERRNENDFRSNIELGGVGVGIELSESVREIAEGAARTLGLDYCGVDVLSDGRSFYICEVNSNAFFKGFYAATGVNVAKEYASYLYNKFYGDK